MPASVAVGGFETETETVRETPPDDAESVTEVVADTEPAVTLKEAEVDPVGMEIDAGTGRIPDAEEVRATVAFVTALALSVAVHLVLAPE